MPRRKVERRKGIDRRSGADRRQQQIGIKDFDLINGRRIIILSPEQIEQLRKPLPKETLGGFGRFAIVDRRSELDRRMVRRRKADQK